MRPTGRGLVSTVAMVGLSMAVLCGCDPSPPGAAPTTSPTTAVPRVPSGGVATPSSLVDTFVGTGVGGSSVGSIDTFPGADMPFGMLQWSPDTSPDRTSGGGYGFKDSALTGFSLTHMSGPGCPVYGDIPILPTVGPVGSSPAATTAAFSHASEVAGPGNYAVTVGRPGVRVELAVTTRAGLGRLRFPATAPANVLFKVADSAAGSARSTVTVVGHDEVDGSVVSGDFCGTSADYHLYFAARFVRGFSAFGTWHAKTVTPGSRRSTKAGTGAYVTFPASTRDVELQVGVSFVSVADARLNIDAEHPGWDIDALRHRDTATWNQLLGRVRVTGGTAADERTFYSELYHSMLHPNVFDDANGDYIGFDDKVHVADGYTQYANFSLWDVYRSEVQLLALVVPARTSDMVRSLLADAAQGGGLPKLPAANFESAQLNGDSADAFIASAYAFGARNFDTTGALAAMVKGATDPTVTNGGHLERQDLAQYLAKGYVRADTLDLTSLTYTVGASETLEYAIDDSAIAQLALALGDTAVARTFSTRAQSWQNLVDPATDYLGGRRADGTFPPGPAFQRSSLPGIGQVGFEEGNAIQYTWSVPQNLRGLFDALGGNAAVVTKLDKFFTHLNAGRKAALRLGRGRAVARHPLGVRLRGGPLPHPGRRPPHRHHAVRPHARRGAGQRRPGGDVVVVRLGGHGHLPRDAGRGELVLASPLFPHITLTLGDGHAIVIDAPGASPATPYVQGLDIAGLTSTDAAVAPGPRLSPRAPLPTAARGSRPRCRRPAPSST